MTGKYFYLTGFLALFCWLPTSFSLSGETASITATAYVLPAVGIEKGPNIDPDNESEPDWLIRCPTTGTVICKIEIEDTISEYSFNNNLNNDSVRKQITLPTGDILAKTGCKSSDSCVVTIIYSEN
jgi:hypothetical protein